MGAEAGRGAVIGDVDGDDRREIVVASLDGKLYSWNADGSAALAPITPSPGGSLIWSAPAIGDIDGDGGVDLVATVAAGRVAVVELPLAPWNPGKTDWPMDQANVGHSGVLDLDTDGDGDPNRTDCSIFDPSVHHGAAELCGGGDENCNGVVDEGFDVDGDSYKTCSYPFPDCNDNNPSIHPGAVEACNLVDDNCNGYVDDGIQNDQDQDGWTWCGGDCQDQDPRVNGIERGGLGWSDISCFDRIDNDCDGVVDWECALDVSDEWVVKGNVSPSQPAGMANMKSSSTPDDAYESIAEGNPGKRVVVYWTFPVPQNFLSVWYDLRVEGFRVSGNGDNFNFSWARRNQPGKCTDTSGETYSSTVLTVLNGSDDDRLQVFQLGPPAYDTVSICVKVEDSNPAGDDKKADTLMLDKLYLFPILLHAKAMSEFTTTGSRLNATSYLQTHDSDNIDEILQEAAPDTLNHTWKFNVSVGYAHQLHFEGWRTNGAEVENFQFYYATPQPGVVPETPGTFNLIPGALVDKARGGINADWAFGPQSVTAPLYGTVWIRILDTAPNGTSLDKMRTDYMSIKTTP